MISTSSEYALTEAFTLVLAYFVNVYLALGIMSNGHIALERATSTEVAS